MRTPNLLKGAAPLLGNDSPELPLLAAAAAGAFLLGLTALVSCVVAVPEGAAVIEDEEPLPWKRHADPATLNPIDWDADDWERIALIPDAWVGDYIGRQRGRTTTLEDDGFFIIETKAHGTHRTCSIGGYFRYLPNAGTLRLTATYLDGRCSPWEGELLMFRWGDARILVEPDRVEELLNTEATSFKALVRSRQGGIFVHRDEYTDDIRLNEEPAFQGDRKYFEQFLWNVGLNSNR